jgi:hypothetical protein
MMFEGIGGYIAAQLIYLLVHLAMYILVLRHRYFFQTERGIFLYHLASAIACSLGAFVLFLVYRTDDAFAVMCAMVAAHGIYSISFLELWSLAQGSYSLSIMERGQSGRVPSRTELIETFSQIGNAKKADRLSGLAGSRLIRLHENRWTLSGTGAVVAAFLRTLLWLANINERG